MTETEEDDYKLNSDDSQRTFHISLINNNQIAMILTNITKNTRYSSYLSLQSLQNQCKAFIGVQTIKEALDILKSSIESGNISLAEDPKDSSISINYDINVPSGHYPDFEVELNLDSNKINNDQEQEELPPTFDYQGNAEAEAKYGKKTSGTTHYNKPIIKSDIKEPIVQLEYIEPILQVHYPDGTTKSTALPPRIQGADGEKANISQEQFKLIQQQMSKTNISTSKRFSPIKGILNGNRANSVNKNQTSMYSTRSTQATSSTSYHLNNNMNNIARQNPLSNVVRPAMNENFNNNMNNINQVRSAFTVTPNINAVNNNLIQAKTSSDYSTMTMPYNKSPYMNNRNYVLQTPNPMNQNNFNNTAVYGNSQYMTQTHNYRNSFEERRQRMPYSNQNNMQRNTARSLSTPGHENMNKFNPNRNANIYQQNQVNYGIQNNQVYQQNNLNTNNYNPYMNNKIPQKPNINPNVNVVKLPSNEINNNNQNIMNQNLGNPMDKTRQMRPNNNALAMQQSQELIQRHQKRLQEVQRQLALIQQQQQKLQEQQRQLVLQQQLQRQILQKQTMVNRSQSHNIPDLYSQKPKFQGFAQVSQIDRQNRTNQNQLNPNTQIRQVQSLTNNPPLVQKNSKEIKQTKTTFTPGSNPPFRTQISSPMSLQTPNLATPQNRVISKQNSKEEEEITEQQIALAQMASMQNQENPNYQNLKAITLQQKEEELQPEEEQEQEQVQEEEEQVVEQQQEETKEDELDIEALFMTEEGKIIFRNGLLRGIIHKYAEIDDVVSKIQDILLKGVKFTLVYKAFDLDDKAKTFHEKCDKLKMSLVLIETDKDIRFGGFTMKSWEGNNIKKKDNNSFVFSLETNTIFDVIKNEPAIGCYPKFGPVFFGCQIRIYDEFFTKGGTTCHKGLNYNTTKDYELNDGEQSYLIKDIEVYAIEAIDI